MSSTPPYTILHIHLELQQDAYSLLKENEAYYFLFWWRQIPLGHLFVELNEKIDRDTLQLKIIRAIQPCIESYQSQSGLMINNYISSFLKNDRDTFLTTMDRIFSSQQINRWAIKPEISVIICTRNRSRELNRCLESLHKQIYPPQEIIVIDNAPTDDQTRQVAEKFKGVIYHKEEKPGLSIARNTGIKLAKSPVIAFADDDVMLHPVWTYRVWETFLYPDVAAMTGLIVASSLVTESQQIFEKYWGFNRGYCDRVFDYGFIESNLKIGPPVWSIGAGANMAFRKSVFDIIGYFDERLGAGASGCSEDSELWFRILMNGFNIHYNPRAIVYHEHRKDMRALKKQLYSYARGHVAAALIQHRLIKKAGYKKRVYWEFPIFYFRRLVKGFPLYRWKSKTLLSEMLGWYSGLLYFKRKCTDPGENDFRSQMVVTDVVKKAKAI